MNDQRSEFDELGHPVGPEMDDTVNPTHAAPDDPGAGSHTSGEAAHRAAAGREMLAQLQQMIDTLAVQAGPVMREVAAKAAELAAVAGEKAGPLAHRAAGVTESVGQRVAARSKDFAADIRKPKTPGDAPGDADADAGAADAGSWAPGDEPSGGQPDSQP